MAHAIDAKPGDLIEISKGMYTHWAIYIGEYEVVHLARMKDRSNPLLTLIDLLDSTVATVRRDNLSRVVGFSHFQVNNFLDNKYEALDRQVIVREACRKVGRVIPYSLSSYNCEHFATEMRYGKPESRQVKKLGVIATATTVGVVMGVVVGGLLISTLSRKKKQKRRECDPR